MTGTDTVDFLLLALDGVRARLDQLRAQVDAIADAAHGINGTKPARAKKQAAETESGEGKKPRKKRAWTKAMREAQAQRLRDRWKRGEFKSKVKTQTKTAATPGRPWTPAQRAKLSRAMKASHRRKTAAAKSATA